MRLLTMRAEHRAPPIVVDDFAKDRRNGVCGDR
jgi:hypothetical protein